MTVKELIKELSNYDEDQIVAVFDDGNLHPVTDVDIDYDANICEEDDVVALYS